MSWAYCRGRSACGPSESAFSGHEWTSMCTPSHPDATAARAIAGIRSGRPVAWLGSTMIGRWLSPWTLGTIDRSSVLRVESSNVRTPRSQRITRRLPCASTYSADMSRSLTVALIPRFSRTGVRVRPTSFRRSKFCMFRAPICMMSV